MTDIAFTKMHGLGNDFVIIDARENPCELSPEGVKTIADRQKGIGCDQVILIELPPSKSYLRDVDVFMHIFNADGSKVYSCGNATRCVANLIMLESAQKSVKIAIGDATLTAERLDNGSIAVDMGCPKFDWRDIPLSSEQNTLDFNIQNCPFKNLTAVNMGNPHCVIFVDDADAIALDEIGPTLEYHNLFPERANIGIAQIKNAGVLRLRVWERGSGITQACGSGACAAAVAAHRRDLTGRKVIVELDGGNLTIDWHTDNHVIMTGPTATSFEGTFNTSLIRC